MSDKRPRGRPKKVDNNLKDNSMSDFVSGLADISSKDTMRKNTGAGWLTLDRSLLSHLYMEQGIVQAIVDLPVDDAFRRGIQIKCDGQELSHEDIVQLEKYLDEQNVLETYKNSLKWGRLYGGAGTIINSGQDPEQPFDIEKIAQDQPIEFYAVDRWELSNNSGSNMLNQFKDYEGDMYLYYETRLHKSHVIRIQGKEAPALYRGSFSGWGMSEIERIIRNFNMYQKNQEVCFELLDESKIDVHKIEGFNSAMASQDGVQKTQKRVALAAQLKNFQNALILDKNDDYEQKQITYAGIADILKEIRIGLASDCRMPMTKLFGLSASGFNSGEDDIENYNAMVESEIRAKCRHGVLKILQVCCKKLFGFAPESLSFEWAPLRMMTSAEESALKDAALNRIVTAYNSGFLSSESVADQVNAAKIFPIDLNKDEVKSKEDMAGLTDQEMDDNAQEDQA